MHSLRTTTLLPFFYSGTESVTRLAAWGAREQHEGEESGDTRALRNEAMSSRVASGLRCT